MDLDVDARRRDRARARDGVEVAVAKAQRHRARTHAAAPRTGADALAQRAEHALGGIGVRLDEGALVRDGSVHAAARIVLTERGALAAELVVAEADRVAADAVRVRAEDRTERRIVRGG